MTNFEKMRYLHRKAGKASDVGKAKKRPAGKTSRAGAVGKKNTALPSEGEKEGTEDEERSCGSAENIPG